jgi:hypothetical protein
VTKEELRDLFKARDRKVVDHVEIGTWIMPLAALGRQDVHNSLHHTCCQAAAQPGDVRSGYMCGSLSQGHTTRSSG